MGTDSEVKKVSHDLQACKLTLIELNMINYVSSFGVVRDLASRLSYDLRKKFHSRDYPSFEDLCSFVYYCSQIKNCSISGDKNFLGSKDSVKSGSSKKPTSNNASALCTNNVEQQSSIFQSEGDTWPSLAQPQGGSSSYVSNTQRFHNEINVKCDYTSNKPNAQDAKRLIEISKSNGGLLRHRYRCALQNKLIREWNNKSKW